MVSTQEITQVLNEYLAFEGDPPQKLVSELLKLYAPEEVGMKTKKSTSASGAKKPNKYSIFVKHVAAIRRGEGLVIGEVSFAPVSEMPEKVSEFLGADISSIGESMTIREIVDLAISKQGNLIKVSSIAWSLIPKETRETLHLEMPA